ncbi:MAG: hypothetical protein Q9227_001025 [Pyrenula ochraceoflavens]
MIQVARASATFVVDEDLSPSQNGFYDLYQSATRQVNSTPPYLLCSYGLNTLHPLEFARRLYEGTAIERTQNADFGDLSARVIRGLCFYYDLLHEYSESPESMLRVHVVPGCIELGQRSYQEIRDMDIDLRGGYHADKVRESITLEGNIPTVPSRQTSMEAIATEMESCILFHYKIHTSNGITNIPPAALALAAAKSKGLVPCSGVKCGPPTTQIPGLLIVSGEGVVPDRYRDCTHVVRFVPRAGPAWCIALMHAMDQTRQEVFHTKPWSGIEGVSGYVVPQVFLRTTECLGCCMKTMLQYERSELITSY